MNWNNFYRNQVNDVDLYIGGLSEEPVSGGLLGPTFTCILARQFRDIKNGDRLWHENGGTNRVFDGGKNLNSYRNYLNWFIARQPNSKFLNKNPS